MRKNAPAFIFVVGGVISGVGKGVTVSSIAKILQDRGLAVTAIKIDPYVNVDAGTMNPTEHGEVFVTSDGDECDQDMGNYERFLNVDLTRTNYMTTGRVYQSVIEKERELYYKGSCVQVVPHIPIEIVERIQKAQQLANADVTIIEIGGTVGEYENILFLEAARMMKIQNPGRVMFVMVSYLPVPASVGEMKTKPTQHSVRTLNASGIQPDIIIARSTDPIDLKRREKISFFCNVVPERVISAPDVANIYEVPLNFEKANLSEMISEILSIKLSNKNSAQAQDWKKFVDKVSTSKNTIKIAIVGKYFETGDFVLSDAYLSVIEAVKYSAFSQNKKPIIEWFNSNQFEKNPNNLKQLKSFDAILVPGGFGSRGIGGLLKVIEHARVNKIPYLGICYGMQLAVIEYAKNVAHIKDATSREISSKSEFCVIDTIDEQIEKIKTSEYGGSMRLGTYEAKIKKGTLAEKIYGKSLISERHRHRFEVNLSFVPELEKYGLIFSGTSKDESLMEIVELPKQIHPFFIAVQFHPEFKARPLSPHPLFNAFIKAAIKK